MTMYFQTPEWVKNAIFYQIFPDRFARSDKVRKPSNLEAWDTPPTQDGFKGGDLIGIVEHLDYLQDLGITAIYLNPIFASASNHRYHTHDYYQVDPILGGNQAFKVFLDEAHRRGLKVVLDGVFNHASRGFFQFNHLLELGAASPYVDWWRVNEFPLNAYKGEPNYDCWSNLPALPEFNTNNTQVREFILGIARYWIEQGIDGWRLDVPYEIEDDDFWRKFREVVKSANPEAYIVGEVATEAQHWLQGDQFDAVMNYQFMQACAGFFIGENINREEEHGLMGLPSTRVLDGRSFGRRVEQLLSIYPDEAALAQLNLLDSHDSPRFLTLANGDKSALRLATLFQMTYPGAPCIYYGDEIGMEGGRHDPDKRRSFPWNRSQWDTDLRQYFKEVIALRKAHPALRTGEFTSLFADEGIYAYLRRLDDDLVIVVLNNRTTSYHLDIPIQKYLPNEAHLHGLTGKIGARVVAGRLTNLALPPRTGIVLGR